MVTPEQIKFLVEEKIEGTPQFVVGVKVSPTKKITVLVDSFEGIGINECIAISRHIESALGEEGGEYELEVSSPGLESAFNVFQQYQKHQGKNVEVYTQSGTKYLGLMEKVNEKSILLSYEEKKKLEGEKKKTLVKSEIELFFESSEPELKIKTTKRVISFKY